MKTMDILKSIFYQIQNSMSIIDMLLIIILCAVIFYTSIFFISKFNYYTKEQIKKLTRDKKYIKNLFIELNETKEVTRYFIYGTKWKEKIVTSFNNLFENQVGNIIKDNIIDKTIKFKYNAVAICTVTPKIFLDNLNSILSLFINSHFNLTHFIPRDDHSYELFLVTDYFYRESLIDIKNKLLAMTTQFFLIKGSAGNGKTNLLCNISELIINTNSPCLFINAREINDKVENYIFKILPIPKLIKNKFDLETILAFFNILLFILRKRLFIVIDAINENDQECFKNSMNDFTNLIKSFTNIKVLMSCRSEYFEERYEKLFNEIQDDKIFIYEMEVQHYSQRAINKLYQVYSNTFGYKGIIRKDVFDTLSKSLLLMRIFFEVYENTDIEITHLNKYKVYKAYFDKLKSQVNNPEILISKVINKMIQNQSFDEVSASEMNISDDEFQQFKKIADENLFISRKIKKYENTLIEKEDEVFYFVFDELKDYCIAKYVITNCKETKDTEYEELYNLLSYMNEKKLSSIEGVVYYSYNYFYETNDATNCTKLINLLIDQNVHRVIRRGIRNSYPMIFDLILDIIFSNNQPLKEYETECLKKYLNCMNTYSFLNLVSFLITCDLKQTIYSISLLNELLLSINDINVLKKLYSFDNSYTDFEEKFLKVYEQVTLSKRLDYEIFITFYILCTERYNYRLINCINTHLENVRTYILQSSCIDIKSKVEDFFSRGK